MSVIGPRPLLVEYLPYYTKEEHHRHDVRPGLSGWAQINGMEAGRKAGIEEGRKTGLELGKKDLLKQQVQKKLLKGKDIDVIAEELEEEVAVIEKVIVELEQ